METQKNIEGNKCTSFANTTEIKSMFTKVIQLQQRPSYQCWNKKLNFNIFFFFCIFDEVVKKLNDQAKKQAQQKVPKGEIKQKDIPKYLNTIKPTLSDAKICSEGSAHNFPNNMKLLKLALLIPSSTLGVRSNKVSLS